MTNKAFMVTSATCTLGKADANARHIVLIEYPEIALNCVSRSIQRALRHEGKHVGEARMIAGHITIKCRPG